MSTRDDELINRVLRNDDRSAFGQLARRYQSPVRSLLRRLTCGDAAMADDLAQETFVRAYLKLGTFRREARLSTWLYRIAYNLFLGEQRRLSGRINRLQAQSPAVPSSEKPSLLSVDLERALAHLTEAERAAVVICCSKGYSHQEAAGILDCPVGTVKTNVRRGKEKLRKHLQAWKGTARDGRAE